MDTYRPIGLRPDEQEIKRADTYLVVNNNRFFGSKFGQLILTDQRLLWLPLRIPLPLIGPLLVEHSEISDCQRDRLMWGVEGILVDSDPDSFEFFLGRKLLNPFAKREDAG